MTPTAFNNVTSFPDPPFGLMRSRGARVASVLEPVCGRESPL
jgi:hypothetical protein